VVSVLSGVLPGHVVRWVGDFILIYIGCLSVQYSLIQVKIIVAIDCLESISSS